MIRDSLKGLLIVVVVDGVMTAGVLLLMVALPRI